jgi:ABC-type methionine transport system ATPase subunit
VLSAQVLPKDLKTLAVRRLLKVERRLKDFKMIQQHPELLEYTTKQIQDNINYLLAVDQSERWSDCVEFNRRLDQTRDQSFTDNTPEFKAYV